MDFVARRLITISSLGHHEHERLSAMRCLFCNAEMVLMEAVQADPHYATGI
jgi:hypothetical protein